MGEFAVLVVSLGRLGLGFSAHTILRAGWGCKNTDPFCSFICKDDGNIEAKKKINGKKKSIRGCGGELEIRATIRLGKISIAAPGLTEEERFSSSSKR